MFHENLRFDSTSLLTIFLLAAGFLLAPLTTSCSAFVSQMTEEQAAQTLRALTKDGKLPPENAVLEIENRFSKTKTGALARLLRAYIHFEANDFNGTAQILSSNVFREKTTITDYALWLRGKSLQQAGNHAEAMNVFAELVRDFPDSIRARESKILWAMSALQSGQADRVPSFLKDLNDKNQPDALLSTAKSYEAQTSQTQAINFYRKVYFYGAGSNEAKEAETKLTALGQSLTAQTAEEIQARADRFYDAKKYAEAQTAYSNLIISFPNAVTPTLNLKRMMTFANLRLMSEAQGAFNMIPLSANEKAEGFYWLARGYANARLWAQARTTVEEMRQKLPASDWTPKTFVAVGTAARDAKNTLEESYFLRSVVASYPNAVEVAGAQFELAWLEHKNNNLPTASQMLTEHLARYAGKDTTNRGKAGYWAARDSERAAKTVEACALYDAVLYRYGANWYGYLALQRLTTLRGQGKCKTTSPFPADSLVSKAAANLKTVTVAAETSTTKELEHAEKSEQLSTVGLFDWAIEELQEAKKTAQNSPKINLALARHYRFRGDNVNALLALAKSYPDYSQMFPEEMGREEWSIFYPLTNWNDIKLWAKSRNLDSYTVAGLIRQESVFNARAKSGANAYGLMQLLIPTARTTAKKYGNSAVITGEALFQPALNIELGTAYMRDQFDKFGRIEFVAVAYNAGPGRVPQWQATLPYEMDEFVEEIPFRETKGYVQGVIRNSAQYRRLYDENGNFKSNIGTRTLRGEIDAKSREQFAQEFPEIVLDENKNAE
ncbi:MAG TPA: transglycosylase SLT domain-containing protein [Pyrinomonadaceae bacterium]|nr:transglycosylase SLT domain-containing protein [Pyrinomonadaceae bacterium]